MEETVLSQRPQASAHGRAADRALQVEGRRVRAVLRGGRRRVPLRANLLLQGRRVPLPLREARRRAARRPVHRPRLRPPEGARLARPRPALRAAAADARRGARRAHEAGADRDRARWRGRLRPLARLHGKPQPQRAPAPRGRDQHDGQRPVSAATSSGSTAAARPKCPSGSSWSSSRSGAS